MGLFETWGDKERLTRFDCAANGGNRLVSDLTIHIRIVWKIGMLPGIVQILVFLLRVIVLILFQGKESSFRRIMRFGKAHFNGGAMMNLTEGAGIETLLGKGIGNGGMLLDEGGDEPGRVRVVHSGRVWSTAGQQARPAGGTDGLLNIRVHKDHAFGGQAIHLRSFHHGLPITASCYLHVIDADEQDILLSGGNGRRQQQNGSGQTHSTGLTQKHKLKPFQW